MLPSFLFHLTSPVHIPRILLYSFISLTLLCHIIKSFCYFLKFLFFIYLFYFCSCTDNSTCSGTTQTCVANSKLYTLGSSCTIDDDCVSFLSRLLFPTYPHLSCSFFFLLFLYCFRFPLIPIQYSENCINNKCNQGLQYVAHPSLVSLFFFLLFFLYVVLHRSHYPSPGTPCSNDNQCYYEDGNFTYHASCSNGKYDTSLDCFVSSCPPAPLFLSSSSSSHPFLQGVLVFPQEVVAVGRTDAYHLYHVVPITLVSLRRTLYVSCFLFYSLSVSLFLTPLLHSPLSCIRYVPTKQ